MSRSYGKIHTFESDWGWPSNNGGYRLKCRNCIRKELRSSEYGDVVFPYFNYRWKATRVKRPLVKSEIRKKYFLDIRNILNGYSDGKYYQYDEIYMEAYKRIKGAIPDNGERLYFDWLNMRKIKKVIKNWTGDPYDALRYLANHGYIEFAASAKFKHEMAKCDHYHS